MNQSLRKCTRGKTCGHRNVKLTSKILLAVLTFAAICAAADTQSVIVVDPRLPKSATTILDLRIEKIDLTGISMDVALRHLADAVEKSSNGRLHFSYGVGFAESEVQEYVRKGIPESRWKLRDQRIKIHATNTTLRDVIGRLCDQSGWSYKPTAIGIAFIDDSSYFSKKR